MKRLERLIAEIQSEGYFKKRGLLKEWNILKEKFSCLLIKTPEGEAIKELKTGEQQNILFIESIFLEDDGVYIASVSGLILYYDLGGNKSRLNPEKKEVVHLKGCIYLVGNQVVSLTDGDLLVLKVFSHYCWVKDKFLFLQSDTEKGYFMYEVTGTELIRVIPWAIVNPREINYKGDENSVSIVNVLSPEGQEGQILLVHTGFTFYGFKTKNLCESIRKTNEFNGFSYVGEVGMETYLYPENVIQSLEDDLSRIYVDGRKLWEPFLISGIGIRKIWDLPKGNAQIIETYDRWHGTYVIYELTKKIKFCGESKEPIDVNDEYKITKEGIFFRFCVFEKKDTKLT